EDEPLLVRFHETLSDRSVYLRYFHMIKLSQRTAHERLTRICFIDYDREMVLVADYADPATGEREILAVGRLSKRPGMQEAELSILVNDRIRGKGLGTELLSRLLAIGRDEKLRRLTADIIPENACMLRICQKLGFHLEHALEEGVVKAEIELP